MGVLPCLFSASEVSLTSLSRCDEASEEASDEMGVFREGSSLLGVRKKSRGEAKWSKYVSGLGKRAERALRRKEAGRWGLVEKVVHEWGERGGLFVWERFLGVV